MTAKPRTILVVEDEEEIASLLRLHLEDEGWEVKHAATGRRALQMIAGGAPDLVILDLMLPDMDGLEICREIRRERDYCPILMLTARGSEVDRIVGLELGADDYLPKPFSIREVVARVRALFRRVDALAERKVDEAPESVEAHGIHLDPARRRVTVRGRPVQLTAKEFDLLHYLARHPGRVYTRGQLLDAVWGYGHEGYEHTVNSHINRLRGKIEDDAAKPRYILTVWGVGYKFPDRDEWAES